MKPVLLLSLFALLAMPVLADDVVAQMGSTVVKADDVKPLLQSLDPKQQEAVNGNPAVLDQAVRSILVQKAVYQEALSKKWDQQADVVAQLQRVRESAITESYLASVAKPPADYPSDADLKAAYDAVKAKLVVPKQYRLAQIFVAKGNDAQGKLDALKKNLGKSDSDFAAFARASSDDKQSAARGGEIGWVAEAQIQPELRSKVTALSKGAVSDPIQLADGWHVLKVLDIKESYTASLDEVKPRLTQELRNQKAQQLRQAYLANMVKQNPITVNQIALTQALPKASK
jgi:parvulin-like peptidyl-prolyl isomerase